MHNRCRRRIITVTAVKAYERRRIELIYFILFSEKNTGCTGQEEISLTYTLQKQKVQSKLEHE